MKSNFIEGLRAESKRLKEMVRKIDDLIAIYEQPIPDECMVTVNVAQKEGKQTAYSQSQGSDYSKMTRPEACYAILSEAKRPLNRSEILEIANAGGAAITDIAALSSVLSRDKRFKTGKRGFWTLATETRPIQD